MHTGRRAVRAEACRVGPGRGCSAPRRAVSGRDAPRRAVPRERATEPPSSGREGRLQPYQSSFAPRPPTRAVMDQLALLMEQLHIAEPAAPPATPSSPTPSPPPTADAVSPPPTSRRNRRRRRRRRGRGRQQTRDNLPDLRRLIAPVKRRLLHCTHGAYGCCSDFPVQRQLSFTNYAGRNPRTHT